MAAHSRPRHLIFCGSHAGVSIGEDGPSQMGLEDIAMFRALGESTVLCPSDAVSAQRLTEVAMRTEGIVYLRTARPATAVLYASSDEFMVGGSTMLRQSNDDQATLVATGIGVYSAFKAHDELRQQGILTRVVDAYSIKPLDIETLTRAARETRRIFVIEDHWVDGGLGDAVAAALGGIAPVQRPGGQRRTTIRHDGRVARTSPHLEPCDLKCREDGSGCAALRAPVNAYRTRQHSLPILAGCISDVGLASRRYARRGAERARGASSRG